MDSSTRRILATAITYYLPLISFVLIKSTLARELRPSDHGLEYQSPPPESAIKSPEMRSFFKVPSSSSSASSDAVPLPKAMKSNDTSWLNDGRGRGGGGGDHVKYLLLTASLVCGVTGVALLVASGFIYLFRHKRNNNNNTK